MTSLDRWHLGRVVSPDGAVPRLAYATRYDGATPLTTHVHHAGRQLQFCLSTFAVPVATAQIAAALADVVGQDLQRIPLSIDGEDGYEVLNALRSVPCLDERFCTTTKWTAQDHRADLAGQYRQVIGLTIDPNVVPADAHFFRVEGWRVALVVSDVARAAMEAVGCSGAIFADVMPGRPDRVA